MPAKVKWTISFLIGGLLLWLGWILPAFLIAFEVMLCIVLVLIILMQSGSAADLAGAFGGAGSQTAFGPRSAATFLTKATVWCGTMFMVTSLVISLHSPTGAPGISTVLSKTTTGQTQTTKATKPALPVKTAPAPAPAKPKQAPVHLPGPAAPVKQPPKH